MLPHLWRPQPTCVPRPAAEKQKGGAKTCTMYRVLTRLAVLRILRDLSRRHAELISFTLSSAQS
jgi:hypothetical protein